LPRANAELLRQNDHGSALRGLVGKRCELSRVRQLLLGYSWSWEKARCLPVADRYGPRLIQQQNVNISRCFHSATATNKNILLHQTVDAGYTDGAEKGPVR
jgi:hypothetical protein